MKSVIDLGWFAFIARPMLWLLNWFYNVFGNWGVAIILLTVLVKLATLYWTTKSMRSMKAMAALKPEMEAIQKRYPDDRQKQQQAQMALFKQHGVSPLAGCLPMLLQMPIWIALYRMLSSAGELHQAAFIPGWLDDLTVPDPYYILPITLTGMMFLQSKLQPATGDSMQQKILMYGMPLMFGGMSLFFPSGLTVYIFTNTVLGILHSVWMNRTTPAHQAAMRAKVTAAAAAAAAKEAEAAKVPAEVRRAKPVTAVVTDVADDDSDEGDEGDDGPRPTTGGSKGSPGGATRRRGQRRGKRRG
jgi:YidC/Oxa1 family membrane protein insertase